MSTPSTRTSDKSHTRAGRDESPRFRVADTGGRPYIKPYSLVKKYRPGDQVYFTVPGSNPRVRQGPYTVRSPAGEGKYILVDEGGKVVNGGQAVSETDLEDAAA
ncbi:hypothetical protein Z517_09886 [Fonsecaea pedrosoi CBS 271.37]|uniref:Unplaced genomic scaffold supercont1.6, whole genome shotgun sequence n=1 Tax=Fonsecaea pedrosoi CBS 271.37 TaxID=1442368 RepID=A0A0D2GFS7_9EURO|nr:uncharacterized protein Z517_09886 [Fonsecaea pedrosoi CBS 271.37]KIW77440.1 hypothetical protein Z517_09886 [Fonsecaea pedrosoi CBS 271.37]